MDTDTHLPGTTHVGRTALVVGDRSETTAFYRDVVGLTVRTRGAETTTLGAGGTPLLVLREDPDAQERHPSGAGLYHNAFRVPSRGALGDALERIRERWRLDGASDHHVSEALYLADPEGNGVEVYRDRPREAWPIADDGTVRMDTLPLDLDDLADAADGGADAPPGTDVGHVHLEVSDLGAARGFYADALGLRVRQAFGGSALFLAAGDYHHHVGLNTWGGRTRPAAGRGLDWFELVVPGRDALDAARRRLEAAGVTVTRIEEGEGFEATDPDGIAVRVRVAGSESP